MEDDMELPDEALRTSFEALWRPLRATDIVGATHTPPQMLIADLIRSQSIVLVSGEPFTGKTMFLLAAALSLDTGMPLLDQFLPAENHRTLFVGQDAPTWDYFGQVSALARGYQQEPTNLSSIYVLNKGLAISLDKQFRQFVDEAVSIYGIDVLMLDVLKSFHNYDENSNVEMSKVMDLLKSIRDKHGLTIFITHHTTKPYNQTQNAQEITGNYRARGASVISGSIDQHFLLVQRGNAIQLHVPKARGHSHPVETIQFQIVQSFPTTGRALKLAPFVDGRRTAESMTFSSLLSAHLSSLRRSQWTLKNLYDAIRPEIRFAHLSDAQVYTRISNGLKALQKEGKARNLSHGLWTS